MYYDRAKNKASAISNDMPQKTSAICSDKAFRLFYNAQIFKRGKDAE